MADLFIFLYPLVAIATVVGYLPQIHKLIIATRRPQNVSLTSWVIWFFSGYISVGYAFFALGDTMLALTALLNAILITVTMTMIIYNNYIRFENKSELKQKITDVIPQLDLDIETANPILEKAIKEKII